MIKKVFICFAIIIMACTVALTASACSGDDVSGKTFEFFAVNTLSSYSSNEISTYIIGETFQARKLTEETIVLVFNDDGMTGTAKIMDENNKQIKYAFTFSQDDSSKSFDIHLNNYGYIDIKVSGDSLVLDSTNIFGISSTAVLICD